MKRTIVRRNEIEYRAYYTKRRITERKCVLMYDNYLIILYNYYDVIKLIYFFR